MPELTRKKGEISRERIMAAAEVLFLHQGYHATTMRQITHQAGMTMGGIYTHFNNKEEIWTEVFVARHPIREMLQVMQSTPGDTIADYVHNAAHRMVSAMQERRELLNLMFIELVEFNGRHFQDLIKVFLPEFIQIGQRLDRLEGNPSSLPHLILARSFIGFFFSYFMTDMLLGPQAQVLFPADALEKFVNIYLYGILAEENPTRITHA